MALPGSFDTFSGAFISQTASSGMISTATSQDTSSEIETTAKIENVYSPPSSRQTDRHEAGRGDERAGEHGHRHRLVGVARGLHLVVPCREPHGDHVDGRHRVVHQQPSAMISAPSEMRCRSMSAICMIGKTIASVSGKDQRHDQPGRPPSDTS